MPTLNTTDSTIWIGDASGKIGTVDLSTGAVTSIGNSGVALTDIAISPTTGQIFGETFSELYSIDAGTGAATPIGPFQNSTDMNGLTFDGNGTLYGSAGSDLYIINPTNGLATKVGSSGLSGWASAGDLAFLHGALYETVTPVR
jgi:hypothetical protein